MMSMKTYFINLIIIMLALFITSCDEEVLDPVIGLEGTPELTNPRSGANWVLEEEKASEILTTITWKRADFGFSSATVYKLEADLSANNFSEAVVLATTALEEVSLTHNKLNSVLLAKGIDVAAPVPIDLRVKASVSSDIPSQISKTVTVNVTPYIIAIDYPQLQVPGAHQGWDPADNSTVIFSVKSDGNYEGYLFFDVDNNEYKYTDGPSWDVNYGDDGADGTLESGSSNIMAGEAGVYKLNVDLNGLTHTRELANWGVLGDATPGGWDFDQDLIWNQETGIMSVTLQLTAGELKFRANDDWALNFGDDNTDGTLEYGAANIPVADGGNYLIELILNQAVYTYRLTKL